MALSGIQLGGSLAAASVVFFAGWTVKGWQVDSQENEALKAQRDQHEIALNALQAELDASAAETLRLAGLLDEAQANTRTVTREIIREVPNVVQSSTPECNCSLSPGLVSLHNAAARGVSPSANEAERPAIELSGGVSRSEYPRD